MHSARRGHEHGLQKPRTCMGQFLSMELTGLGIHLTLSLSRFVICTIVTRQSASVPSNLGCSSSPSTYLFCAFHSLLMLSIVNFFLSVQLIASVLLARPGRRLAGAYNGLPSLVARVVISTSCLRTVLGDSILEMFLCKLTICKWSFGMTEQCTR